MSNLHPVQNEMETLLADGWKVAGYSVLPNKSGEQADFDQFVLLQKGTKLRGFRLAYDDTEDDPVPPASGSVLKVLDT